MYRSVGRVKRDFLGLVYEMRRQQKKRGRDYLSELLAKELENKVDAYLTLRLNKTNEAWEEL